MKFFLTGLKLLNLRHIAHLIVTSTLSRCQEFNFALILRYDKTKPSNVNIFKRYSSTQRSFFDITLQSKRSIRINRKVNIPADLIHSYQETMNLLLLSSRKTAGQLRNKKMFMNNDTVNSRLRFMGFGFHFEKKIYSGIKIS